MDKHFQQLRGQKSTLCLFQVSIVAIVCISCAEAWLRVAFLSAAFNGGTLSIAVDCNKGKKRPSRRTRSLSGMPSKLLRIRTEESQTRPKHVD